MVETINLLEQDGSTCSSSSSSTQTSIVVSDGYQSAPKPLKKALPFPLKQPCTTAFVSSPSSKVRQSFLQEADNMCNDGSCPYQNNFYLKVRCEGAEVEVVVHVDRNTMSTCRGTATQGRMHDANMHTKDPAHPRRYTSRGEAGGWRFKGAPFYDEGGNSAASRNSAHITQSRAFPNRAAFCLE
jgi:hypothetical protein